MAAALAQTAQVSDGSAPAAGGTIAYGSNVTSGNTLILGLFAWYTAFAPTSVTDTQGNTWTKTTIGASNVFITGTTQIWTAVAGSSGANTVTITASGGAATYGSFLIEVTGLATNPYDTYSATVSNTSSPVSGTSITPSANGAYLVMYKTRGGVFATNTTNSSFVFRAESPSNGTNAMADYTQTTAAAITADLNASASGSYPERVITFAFKAATGGAVNKGYFF